MLAQLTKEVYAVERLGPLLEKAKANMRQMQQFNVRLKHADGQLGLPEAAPSTASSSLRRRRAFRPPSWSNWPRGANDLASGGW